MLSRGTRRAGLVPLALLLAAGSLLACLQTPETFINETVRITSATGEQPRARLTRVTLHLDNCNGRGPRAYRVVTTDTPSSVTFTVTGPVWTGEAQAACADGTVVTLPRPLGQRTLVDGSTGRAIALTR